MVPKTSAVLSFIVFSLSFCSQTVRAATATATSCSQSAVQTAINSAKTGDTVLIPGGTCAWSSGSSGVTIPSTVGLTLDGQGTTTITAAGTVNVTSNSTNPTRITGITFSGNYATQNGAITITGTSASAPYRIDNCTFTDTSNDIFVQLSGNGPGLLDHNGFTGGGAAEAVHNLGMGAGSNASWTDNIAPGSPYMVYMEDNTFATNNTTYICSGIESFYGARTVIRHNTFSFCQVDQHGTTGMIGARWWEVYDNIFYTPPGEAQCCYITMRGGTGVIFGNTTSGSNAVTADIDLYEEDTGTWPLAYQVGSGINGGTNGHNSCSSGTLNSAPAYIWGNGTIPVDSQTPTLVKLNRDYFVSSSQPSTMTWQENSADTCSTTYTYSPFTYPYPLTSNGLPNPSGNGGIQAPSIPPNVMTAVR